MMSPQNKGHSLNQQKQNITGFRKTNGESQIDEIKVKIRKKKVTYALSQFYEMKD